MFSFNCLFDKPANNLNMTDGQHYFKVYVLFE